VIKESRSSYFDYKTNFCMQAFLFQTPFIFWKLQRFFENFLEISAEGLL